MIPGFTRGENGLSTRREVLRTLTAVAGLVFAVPSAMKAAAKLAIPLDRVEKLKEVGGFALLKIREMEILFIRDSEDTVKALNPVCTHKKCTVEYSPEAGMLVCPCHGSTFELDGTVTKGPAEQNLATYEAALSEGRIILTVEE